MEVIDLHCDVLEKLTRFEDAQFRNDPRIQANLTNLIKGQIKVQVFAIFISPDVPQERKFLEAARQIEAFHTKVLCEPEMVHITDWQQIQTLQEGQIGAVLSLEGCDCIGEDLAKLKLFLDAGVKLVGLTWNYENAVAYGALEDPKRGLKPFAKEVIQLLNERDIVIDVAHLNEQGFYGLLPMAKYLIASHCNVRALCDHPRNLTDDQITQLIQNGGRMHVVFYPPFIEKEKDTTSIEKLVEHVVHLANLIGIEHIGFGSDFDGIDPLSVTNLSNASEYRYLMHSLTKQFTNIEVETMAKTGFLNYVAKIGTRMD
ncbi:dipeptidase [Lysinibacillus sp. BW-2-10]|uniref:dipeptidase n=1 Tax=Lysinibacillus sp. BW-2-10 TaxID=2590030 RepID=UPI001180D2DD|nr:membrane dipeptidase [Lysinibacillus sp. BW-2-10]TSI03027.1 membrane dipeptidase [Lysinibacillus sp. BW-2-10]